MYSLEAIISLIVLLSFFGIVSSSIVIQNNHFNEFSIKTNNYFEAIKCATIIDFSFSNNVRRINIENCFGEDNSIFVKNSNQKIKLITKIKKMQYLGIDMDEHYIK